MFSCSTPSGNLHMSTKRLPHVKCPTCKKVGNWFAGPYGPFCSERCKQIDLGKWFNEEHRISVPLESEPEEAEALPGGAENEGEADPDAG